MLEASAVLHIVLGVLAGLLGGWLFGSRKTVELKVRLEERDLEVARKQASATRSEEIHRDAVAQLERRITEAQDRFADAEKECEGLTAVLNAERVATDAKETLLDAAESRLRDSFSALAADALKNSSESFLQLAQESLGKFQQSAASDLGARQLSINLSMKPVQDGLLLVSQRLQEFDRDRASSSAALEQHLVQVTQAQHQLAGETRTLVQALRAPQGRGRWGELQLRRVVELAGMVEHCDFVEQETIETDSGRRRPDLVVRLPARKVVVVDSKAPLDAYLKALDAETDVERNAFLDLHAKQVRNHIAILGSKDYADGFTEAPDFVVLFLPGEAFFAAACERDPEITEFAIQRNVLMASPTTLIALLKAVSYGWQQERIAENAEQIRDLGQELYARMRVLAEHLARVRKGLESAVVAFNGAVSSIEGRVLPSARRFRDLGVGPGDEIEVLEPVEQWPRLSAAPELEQLVACATSVDDVSIVVASNNGVS